MTKAPEGDPGLRSYVRSGALCGPRVGYRALPLCPSLALGSRAARRLWWARVERS
jgi:hypothetical protein